MKINIRYTLISIVISFSVAIIFFIINSLKIKKLNQTGVIAEIEEDIFFSGNNEDNYYYNYYFLTKDNLKIDITHNMNRKSLTTYINKYHNKKVIYLEENPLIYLTTDDLHLKLYKYYFIKLPIVFYLVLWFFKDFFLKVFNWYLRR